MFDRLGGLGRLVKGKTVANKFNLTGNETPSLERLVVGKNFRPGIGFLRREDFRGTFASLRFSPRPGSIEAIRKWGVQADLEYVTDGAGLLETRNIKLTPMIDIENGDSWNLDYERLFQF